MGVQVTQVDDTRNQSTALFAVKRLFIFDNRFKNNQTFKNTSGSSMSIDTGTLVARAAGTYETATATFGSALTAGQTMIIAGLTYTSTAATTAAQLAAAFANLDNGATTGAGTATGTYSGALTAYSTGAVNTATNAVTFTAETIGNKTDLTATGTGTSPTFVIVSGSSTTASGLIPVTSANLADTIGIAVVDGGPVTLPDSESLNVAYGTRGEINATYLVLPSGVTLDTVVGNKSLEDILEGIGFDVNRTIVENTIYDNY